MNEPALTIDVFTLLELVGLVLMTVSLFVLVVGGASPREHWAREKRRRKRKKGLHF